MKTFHVKNYEKFQHYKDRNPPWIRFYNATLDDYEFGQLPDASKFHLAAIWLLASRSANKLPYDSAWVARRINATEMVDLDRLAQAGFIIVDQLVQDADQVASIALAKCSPEESRVETEQNRKKEIPSGRDAPLGEVSEAEVFKLGKTVLGKNAGGVITNLKKHLNHDLKATHDLLLQAKAKENPMEWVQAAMRPVNWRDQPEYRGVM